MSAPSTDAAIWVRPWIKGDAHRLYVNGQASDGSAIDYGFVDVNDGTVVARRADMPATEVYRVAATWAVAHAHPCPPARILKDPVPTPTGDLAQRKAGQGLATRWTHAFTREGRRWRTGQKGEQQVGKALARLHGATALHNVQISSGGGDIDHVVFSRSAGIVVISTKHHPGAHVSVDRARGVLVNSQRTGHITQLAMHVDATSRRLSRLARTTIPVAGVLAIVGTQRIDVLSATSFPVMAPGQLTDWFAMRSTSLTGEQVTWLYEQARDPNIWLS